MAESKEFYNQLIRNDVMQKFGPGQKLDTPTDKTCSHCSKAFTETDKGLLMPGLGGGGKINFAYHTKCLLIALGAFPMYTLELEDLEEIEKL